MDKKRRFIIYLATVLFTMTFFYPSSIVMACDCAVPKTANEAKDKAAAVFRGEVLQIKKDHAALVGVSEIWKGIDETQVLVYTDRSSSCQFDFEVGKEYLLYPNERDGKLKVIDCGRSAEIKIANQDLLELGKGKEPANTVHLEEEMKSSNLLPRFIVLLVLFITVFVIVYLRKKKNNNQLTMFYPSLIQD